MRIEEWSRPTEAIVQRLDRAGFALAAASGPTDSDGLRAFAAALGLGAPHNPEIYRTRPYVDRHGVTTISATGDDHPAFHRTSGQRLHTDGTLEAIGEIRTTVQLCVRPAASGGESLIFNAVGAFADLTREDPAAAATLTAPGVLRRTSQLGGLAGQRGVGPAFKVGGDRISTRFSVTDTDSFDPNAVDDPSALARALEFFADAARPGSRHFCTVRLAAGEGLILANDRVSHGRTPYVDGFGASREMLRALFRQAPAARQRTR